MADTNTPSRPLRIFLCHSSADKPAVRELYLRLQSDGFEPWLDEEDLIPGQDWQREIPKAVRTSDVVIVCLSRGSVNKAGYVQKEIKFALDAADEQPDDAIFIIPLKLEECKVPDRLSKWQWVNYFASNGYSKLSRALHSRAESLEIGTAPLQSTDSSQKEQTTQQIDPVVTNQSGGIKFQADQVSVGQDEISRDKVESAGGQIIHAGTDATVNVIVNTPRRDWIRGGLIALLIIVAVTAIIGAIISGNNGTSVSLTQTAVAIAALPSNTISPSATLTHTLAPAFIHTPTSVPASAQITPATLLPAPTIGATSTLVPILTSTGTPTSELTSSPTSEAISTRVSSKDRMAMIYVPAGEFIMGSSIGENEGPEHKVYVDAFWIDQTEVTNAMFRKFVDATSYRTNAEMDGWASVFNSSAKEWQDITGASWQHPRGPSNDLSGLDNYPVVQISWNDAKAYCEWVGRRLPTEAEWEKAARGTDSRIYPWGNQNVTGDLLNLADQNLNVQWAKKDVDDGYQFAAPVGHYPDGASPYGVYDMMGNVQEWVADFYDENYYATSPIRNPTGPMTGQGHILRGGGWNDGKSSVRVTYRKIDSSEARSDNTGFRCAQSAQ